MQKPVFSYDFIVRIYRFKKDDPRRLVGIVEQVGVKGKKAFTNYDELWEILNVPESTQQKAKAKDKVEEN